jgi:hypothetical protein
LISKKISKKLFGRGVEPPYVFAVAETKGGSTTLAMTISATGYTYEGTKINR